MLDIRLMSGLILSEGKFKNLVQPSIEAVTEMIPDLIWAPEFFGPKEI